MSNADNFMNFANRVYELDLPFTISGTGKSDSAAADITCFDLSDYEKVIALAKERNLQAAPFAEGVKLVFKPS
jgi:hypothetical protein